MKETVKERLKYFLKENNIKDSDFCRLLNVSQGYISGMRKSIQPEKLKSIAINYPIWNIGWLLTGEGNKYLNIATNKDIILNDKDCSLYYYTSAETLLKILGAGSTIQIKYSNFNNSNDPKERTLYYRHCINTNENHPIDGKKIQKTEDEKKALENNYKYISFCKQPKSDIFTGKRVTIPRMWAQYGTTQNKDGIDNKSYMNGVCIELDFEKIMSKSEKGKDGKLNKNGISGLSFFDVEYKPESEYYKIYHSNNKINIEDDIRFKYEDWSEEKECRAFYLGTDDYFEIKGCIKRIYLGEDFRHDNVMKLCNVMASKRYTDITPDVFTRIIITQSDGLMQNLSNNSGDIYSDMLEIISKYYPKYYNEINPDDNCSFMDFHKKLIKEQQKDEEKLKLDVENYKSKYITILEENRDLRIELEQLRKKVVQKNFDVGDVQIEDAS